MESKITCYENEIPPFVEEELDRLHGSVYSSPRYLRLVGEAENASTYVSSIGSQPAAIFIYRVADAAIRVLTDVVTVRSDDVNRFAEFAFARYPQVKAIVFPRVETELAKLDRPRYARFYKDDVLVDPPSDPAIFNKELGKSVRRELRRSADRLRKDFPDFEYSFHDETQLSESDTREILTLSRARIEAKNDTWYYTDPELEEVLKLVGQSGLVCVARINGRICGGQICYRFGRNYTFKAFGYDAAYSAYSLGFLLCYLTIEECIRRGADRLNLGFMVYDYKLWLKGRPRRLDRVVLYRTTIHRLLDAPAIGQDFLLSKREELRQLARKAKRGKGYQAALLRSLRKVVRMAKRARALVSSPGAGDGTRTRSDHGAG